MVEDVFDESEMNWLFRCFFVGEIPGKVNAQLAFNQANYQPAIYSSFSHIRSLDVPQKIIKIFFFDLSKT